MPNRHLWALWPVFGTILGAASLGPGCEVKRLVLGHLGEGGAGPAVLSCAAPGDMCGPGENCCLGLCRASRCEEAFPACVPPGQTCASALDCCSLSCVSGLCTAECRADELSCAIPEECCSGDCQEGTCAALARQCATSGNPCSANDECCSGLCTDEKCDPASSFCAQTQDICLTDTDCCSGTCLLSETGILGTCGAAPQGPSNCSAGIAGTLCEDCNDCCSRLCAPFGSTGTSVCVLAQGCRQTGELCGSAQECCGGSADSGLPGAGNVTCDIDDDRTVGVCRNALSCSPQGNVCHVQNYACGVSSAANRCCGAEGEDGLCGLDPQGVPRCNGLGTICLAEDALCAVDGDCCEGACTPNNNGVLRCTDASICLTEGAPCTTSAECCPQTSCLNLTSGAFGRCVSSRKSVSCSLLGQLCEDGRPSCCEALQCSNSRCVLP